MRATMTGRPTSKSVRAILATIYMGAHRPSDLLRANRITEVRPGAVRDLDAAFITERAPYCGTLF